jgi:hypothetical protein
MSPNVAFGALNAPNVAFGTLNAPNVALGASVCTVGGDSRWISTAFGARVPVWSS